MNVSSLVAMAFGHAAVGQRARTDAWVRLSHEIGSRLPSSLLGMSIQRIGRLDSVLRCMEEERAQHQSQDEGLDVSQEYQSMLSELWIGALYEVIRLILDRKLAGSDVSIVSSLGHDLRLVRIPIEKHELAADKKLARPLEMERRPLRGDASDLYVYSRADPKRAHIMPSGLSTRGSLTWQVIDVATMESRWVERLDLSDRALSLGR